MPQLQLPLFPVGVTLINNRVAFGNRDGCVWYVYGHQIVYRHEIADVQSFRMFTSQVIATGAATPREIVEGFGVPMGTVKRYLSLFREGAPRGFTSGSRGTVRPRC